MSAWLVCVRVSGGELITQMQHACTMQVSIGVYNILRGPLAGIEMRFLLGLIAIFMSSSPAVPSVELSSEFVIGTTGLNLPPCA